jgi:hypothetical protein
LLSDIQDALMDDILNAVCWIALVTIVPGAVLGLIALVHAVRSIQGVLFAVGGAAALVVVSTIVVSITVGRPSDERACNGHAELCGRQYNDVVYTATHNLDVESRCRRRLARTRRRYPRPARCRCALLIDTHYWPPANGPTDLIDVSQAIGRGRTAIAAATSSTRSTPHWEP